MIENALQVIGCGQCGTRIGLKFAKLGVDTYYINSDELDVRGTFIDARKLLLLGTSGTGGSPLKGKSLLKKHWKEFEAFIEANIDPNKLILVICGLGGGTGGSAAPLIINYLNKKKISTGCIATLPPRMQGILAADNSLKTLKQLKDLKINMFMLADNEYLMQSKGIGNDWWEEINNHIVIEVKSAFELLREGKVTQAGIGSIDKGEIMRVLQYGNGMVDIRTMYFYHADFRTEDKDLLKKIFKPSLAEGYTYKSTLAYLIGIDIPKKKIYTKEAKKIFDITKRVCGSAISRLGMFADPMLDDVVRVTMINAGLKLPRVLQSRINNLKRDEKRFVEKKAKEDILDLSELEDGVFEEDFNI